MYRFFFLSPQTIPYFSSRLMLPLPASIANDKENGTNNPVHRHGDPDTEDAESHTHTEHIAHADSADPHGKNRENHAKCHIIGRAEYIRQIEGNWPDYHTADAVVNDDIFRHGCCLRRQTVNVKHRRKCRDDTETADDHHAINDDVQLYGNEFTELTNNTLNVRLQKADTSYEYFTLQAKDKAGNMSEIYKVGNPYYENPDAVKENTEVSGTEQNAASLPADGTASKPTSATATVTEHQTTNETATAPTEPENTGNETDTEADTGRVQGESSASGMTTGTVQDKGGKEFYTIKTKSDKVFYLIVDKDKTDENVYLLTEVGENDLLNFTDTNMVTLPQNQAIAESALPLETEKITETPEPEVTIIPEEKEEPEKKSNNSGTILLMLLVLAGVCGAYYYWKFMKGRNTSFDYEEDEDDDEEEEDTIREDDEELEEYEMEGEVEGEESEE